MQADRHHLYRRSNRYETEEKFKQSGITISANNTSDGRMQALAGAAAAFKGLTDAAGIFLEKGDSSSGLRHILERHSIDFTNKGIVQNDIPDVLMNALSKGRIVGSSGSAPVYEIAYKGTTQYLAIGVGSNGYVVRANPVTTYKASK